MIIEDLLERMRIIMPKRYLEARQIKRSGGVGDRSQNDHYVNGRSKKGESNHR